MYGRNPTVTPPLDRLPNAVDVSASVPFPSTDGEREKGRFAFLLDDLPVTASSSQAQRKAVVYSQQHARDPFAPLPADPFAQLGTTLSSSLGSVAANKESSLATHRTLPLSPSQPLPPRAMEGADKAKRCEDLERELEALTNQFESRLLEAGVEAWEVISQQKAQIHALEQEVKRQQRLLHDREDRLMCLFCSEKPREVVFMRCRHCCLCVSCARSLFEDRGEKEFLCVVCKEPVVQAIRVFFP
eukprot:gene6703-7411_t